MTNEEIFFAAVAKGIEHNDGFFEFDDPGLSIDEMCDIRLQQSGKNIGDLFYAYFWCRQNNFPWIHTKNEPQRVCLRFPKKAIGMSLADQRACLIPSERVASLRRVVTLLIISLLTDNKSPLDDFDVRCAEFYEKDYPSYVGTLNVRESSGMPAGKITISASAHADGMKRVGIAAEAN